MKGVARLRGRIGSALAGALLIIAVALLATFVVAGSTSINLQLAQRAENGQIASMLAHSLIHQAIAELGKDITFATDLTLPGVDSNSSATLTFTNSGGPYSTNNRSTGWVGSRLLQGGRMPPQRVHLVAVGTSHNVKRTVEALVNVPNFTTSLASTGKVTLDNSIVGALQNVSDASLLTSNPSLLKPGDLATNSSDAHSVNLTGGSLVSGNLQSCGPVNVSSDSRVQGELRFPWSAATIPNFQITDYDPALNGVLNFQTLSGGSVGDQSLVGMVKTDASLVINGDLNVDNCLFYVTGNLTVTGSVRGNGAIIVNGNTLIQGGTGLTSDDCVALLSSGNITLTSSTDCQINGMLYTQGDFTARHFKIVGSFMANGANPGQGNVFLQDSAVLHVDVASRLQMFAPRQFVVQIAGENSAVAHTLPAPSGNQDAFRYGNFPGDGVCTPPVPNVPWITPAQAIAHVNGLTPSPFGGDSESPWHWYDTVTVQMQKEAGQIVYYLIYQSAVAVSPNNGQHSPERYTTHDAAATRLADLARAMCPAYCTGADLRHPDYAAHKAHWDSELTTWENQPPGATGVQPDFSIDPNRFLTEQQKIRISAISED